MQALIYTRGHNIESQVEKCNEYAALNGYTIVKIVNTDNELAAELVCGKVDILLVSDRSRVARQQKQYLFAEKMLQGYGVKLVIAQTIKGDN